MKSFGTYHVWYWRWGILSLLITFHFSLLTSCTRDAYEKGEGAYSLMRGDFAEANVNSNCEITSITTDDGETLPLTILQTAQWISSPDTIYRCMLYYNKVKAADGPLAMSEKTYKDDPVKFESLWRSKSGKYLNLHLQLKTGYTEDSTAMSASRQRVLALTLSVFTLIPIPAPSSRRCLFNSFYFRYSLMNASRGWRNFSSQGARKSPEGQAWVR